MNTYTAIPQENVTDRFKFTSYKSFLDQAAEDKEYDIELEEGQAVLGMLCDYLKLSSQDLKLWFEQFDTKLTFEDTIKATYFAWARDYNLQEIAEISLDDCFMIEGDEEDLTREILSDKGPFKAFEENGISEHWLNIDLIVSDTMEQFDMAIVEFNNHDYCCGCD